jgi:hypothetical protein
MHVVLVLSDCASHGTIVNLNHDLSDPRVVHSRKYSPAGSSPNRTTAIRWLPGAATLHRRTTLRPSAEYNAISSGNDIAAGISMRIAFVPGEPEITLAARTRAEAAGCRVAPSWQESTCDVESAMIVLTCTAVVQISVFEETLMAP